MQIGHWILFLLILGMMIANAALYRAYRRSESRAAYAIQKMQALPESYKKEAEAHLHNIQSRARVSFAEMISNMKLSNQMSRDSEGRLQELIKKRESARASIKTETLPSMKLEQAFRALDLDKEIIRAYQDELGLQSMHRVRLMEKLAPLARELGLEADRP